MGVYMLFLGEQLQYVGQSENVRQRVVEHRSLRRPGKQEGEFCNRAAFLFDRVEWMPVGDWRDRLAYERAIALALNPQFTFRVQRSGRRDKRILRELGITEWRKAEFKARVAARNEARIKHYTECRIARRVIAFIDAVEGVSVV